MLGPIQTARIENSNSLINFICANLGLKVKDKQSLLEIDELKERGYSLLGLLSKELQMLEIKLAIHSKTQVGIEQQQKEYFLQQQIKAIQDELGGDTQSHDIQSLRDKAAHKKWDKKVKDIFEKELGKLERTSPHSPRCF